MSEHVRSNDIAIIRDHVNVRITARVSERAVIRDSVRQSRGLGTNERATIRDHAYGVPVAYVIERATVRDRLKTSYVALAQVSDKATVSDHSYGALGVRITEVARVKDSTIYVRSARVVERAVIRDSVRGGYSATGRATERARLKDRLTGAVAAVVSDNARVSDAVRARATLRVRVSERVTIRDSVRVNGAARARVTERARITDRVTAQYTARARVNEVALITDSVPLRHHDRAWTACLGRWSHSRYEQYPYDSLVVVNGQAFGAAQDGVYALSGGDEIVHARVQTAALDFSRQLALPEAFYMAYSLTGDAELTVTQTQDGVSGKSWPYKPDRRASEALTTGRFVLGRGLRARHYTLRLDMTGTAGRIEDAYVDFGESRRRIY